MSTAATLPLDPDLRRRLIALAGCAAQGRIAKGRPILANLCFRGRHVCATDSYVLSRVTVPEGADDLPDVLVPAAPLAKILRGAPKKAEVTLTVTADEVRVTVTREDLLTAVTTEHVIAPYDGPFPHVRLGLLDDVREVAA